MMVVVVMLFLTIWTNDLSGEGHSLGFYLTLAKQLLSPNTWANGLHICSCSEMALRDIPDLFKSTIFLLISCNDINVHDKCM